MQEVKFIEYVSDKVVAKRKVDFLPKENDLIHFEKCEWWVLYIRWKDHCNEVLVPEVLISKHKVLYQSVSAK